MMSNSAPGPAVSILRRVAEVRSCCAQSTAAVAICLFHNKQYDEATVAFDDCLGKLESTSPQCPECEAELSLAWLGVDPDSGGDVQTVFQRNDIMTWLARCLFALNDVANAVALVNRVIAVRPIVCTFRNFSEIT